ncbi:hypothetical protein [Calothrix sp. PCC 7507]|uniref:hypothetical protein n=1 Tax=Calothrix sp. PCC 7507 TaxID=99598 RepID=UPI00135F19F5|nr:hypothetical protein [Calothrix sp. PCC 7507]
MEANTEIATRRLPSAIALLTFLSTPTPTINSGDSKLPRVGLLGGGHSCGRLRRIERSVRWISPARQRGRLQEISLALFRHFHESDKRVLRNFDL